MGSSTRLAFDTWMAPLHSVSSNTSFIIMLLAFSNCYAVAITVFELSWIWFFLLCPLINEKIMSQRCCESSNAACGSAKKRHVDITIDLFSLYILFSHFRPRDATRGNSFFQMSSYARANLRITNEKTKGKFPWGYHVVWNGKTKCTSWKGL